jgi:hypothetical protein
MAQYKVEVELRTFYEVTVNAHSETDAARIALYNTNWQASEPVDQACGVNSVEEVTINESVEGQANE